MNTDDRFHFTISKRTLHGLACVCLGGLLAGVGVVYADDDRATQSIVGSQIVVPYDGYLMLDGEPITGPVDVKFDVYEAETGGTSVWDETQAVSCYGGRFSVGLGSSSAMTATLLDAEQLWLGLTIIDASGTEIPLAGRQAIEAVPFAAWTTHSADFNVAGNLKVEGDADIDGDTLQLGASNASAFFENASNQLYISPSQGHSGGVYFGNTLQMNYTTTVVGAFSTQGTTNLGNGTDDDTTVAGDLTVKGAATLRGTVSTQGAVNLGNGSTDDITVSGPLTTPNNITFADDRDITGADIIAGDGNLRFRASASRGSDDLSIATDGDVTVAGDLLVDGDLTNLTVSSSYDATASNTDTNGTVGPAVGDSFCVLTDVDIKGLDGDGQDAGCYISTFTVSGTARWTVYAKSVSNGGPINCSMRCVTW